MKGELPGRRRAHTCDLIGGKYLYMFGGGDGTVIRNDVHILDTDSLVWTKMKPSGSLQPGARGYHSSCVLGNIQFDWLVLTLVWSSKMRTVNVITRTHTQSNSTL